MTEKPTYEQLEKQLQLAEMSNSALRYSLKRNTILSQKRLLRNKALRLQLNKKIEELAALKGSHV